MGGEDIIGILYATGPAYMDPRNGVVESCFRHGLVQAEIFPGEGIMITCIIE